MIDKTCRVSVDELNHDLEQMRLEAKHERKYEARKWITLESELDTLTFDSLLEIMAEFSEADQAKTMKMFNTGTLQLGDCILDSVIKHVLDKIEDGTIPLVDGEDY